MLVDDACRAVGAKQLAAGQQFVEHHAGAV
jgi:hypothetical protein